MKKLTPLIHFSIGLGVILLWYLWPPFISNAQKLSYYLSEIFGSELLTFMGPVQIMFFVMGITTGCLCAKGAFYLSSLQVLPSFIFLDY